MRGSATGPATAGVCGGCGRPLAAVTYEVRSREGTLSRCLRCALGYAPLVRRSLLVCLLVGTLLVAINQGNVIVQGDASLALAWKVPLTYAVPYCVATAGAIMNARTRRLDAQAQEPSEGVSWEGGEEAAIR